ncbi:TRAP transporter, DctQ-like membrane protein, putative [Roseobacter sp. CCS2]|nr:TRAP transporter, DctQ-like membrane protein, putative [Roseobacter sp. CCS2]
MLKLSHHLDMITDTFGRGLSWLAIAMVLLQGAVVFMRYVFGLSILWMQEGILYLHAIIFLSAAGYTLLHDGHVRVDIFYSDASPRTKAMVDIIGVVFLLAPVCVLLLWAGWPYVAASWAVWEGSMEPSGIPAMFLLKTCILLFPATLLLQGVSLLLRSVLVLRGVLSTNAWQDPQSDAGG